MTLPLRIKNVRYKVAGEYAYKGDMIITEGVIYYFPHTDLVQQRINRTVDAMSYAAAGVGGGVAGVAGNLISDLGRTDSDTSAKSLLNGERSNLLQEKLDAYIAEMKAKRSSVTLSSYLPIPLRYTKDEVRNLSLTAMGSVSFDAQYDTHFYNIGLVRKGLLRAALSEGGFIRR